MPPKYYVTSFYRFFPIASLEQMETQLFQQWQDSALGLVILAKEGLNSTMQFQTAEARTSAQSWLTAQFGITNFKDSESAKPLFRQFVIKHRPEIVTLGTPELLPQDQDDSHLTPEQWHQWLNGEQKFNLLDTRNDYEVRIGKFRNAIDPQIEQFTELPQSVDKMNLPKDEPVLMYCTGGIRCEKAALELKRRGFEKVYQLQGGILKYLERFPNQNFEGECFVFDDRVAVTQELAPSLTFGLCPHCSDPASQLITCERCGGEAKICENCLVDASAGKTCSKECRHHFVLKPWQKARRKFERESKDRSDRHSG